MSAREPIGILLDDSGLARQPFFSRRLGPLPTIELPDLDEDVRALARRGWEDRTRAEYRGVLIVRRFHTLLAEVNAPADVQELALAMMLQEQQHARLCMAAARSLGSDGEVAFETEELAFPVSREPIHAQLLRAVVATYVVGEVVALALIRHAIRALPETGYRETLRWIARDEVLHARIGGALLRESRDGASWLPWPGDGEVRALGRAAVGVMAGRDVVEPDEAAAFADPSKARQLSLVGIPPSHAFKAAYHRALAIAVPRAFERAGLDF